MKEFIKGNLITVVDDDDRRISEYRANGWKERPLSKKSKDKADERMESAIAEANASEDNGKKNHATDKKVNDAINACETATEESEVIDDGLIKETSKDVPQERGEKVDG